MNKITFQEIKMITKQMGSICKIIRNNVTGTGFICKIPFPDSSNKLTALITNGHIFGEKEICIGNTINLSLNNDKIHISISIDNKRKVYFSSKYDITIIEIKTSEIPNFDINSFLEIDEGILKEKKETNSEYKNINVYLIYYLGANETQFSTGIIKSIKDENILHLCNTGPGSSGAPILNLSNFQVIGIHKGYLKNKNCNIGTFLNYPIKEFIELNIQSKKNEKNEEKINLKKRNEELKKELDNERLRNKELMKEINELKNIIEVNKYKKGENLLNNNNNINGLLEEIRTKNEEIKELKKIKSRYPIELLEGEELMTVIFTSFDQRIHYAIICKNTDLFSKIEKELYDEYPEYGEEENYFMVNGNKIIKHKTIKDNKIHNSDIITLKKIEDY